MALAEIVHGLKMCEAGRAYFAFIRFIGSIRNQKHSEFALWSFNRHINLARGNMESFGEELEVVNKRFHRPLHLPSAWWSNLVVLDNYRTAAERRTQLFKALFHNVH